MSKFNEAVDLAVEAAKRGVVIVEQVKSDAVSYCDLKYGIERRIFDYFSDETLDMMISELVCLIADSKVEKFVVETAEDVERIKKGATIQLANGNVIVTEQYASGLFYINENMFWVELDYTILKDAIIDQKGE